MNVDPPPVVRLVFKGRPPKDADQAVQLLLRALRDDDGAPADVWVAPGRFVHVVDTDLPPLSCGWDTDGRDAVAAVAAAARGLADRLDRRFWSIAKRRTKLLIVGVDVHLAATDARVEAAVVFDAATGKILRATGASLPGAADAATTVHVIDVDSHCVRAARRRVVVLSGHDLVAYHPRSRATAQGTRKARATALRAAVAAFCPDVVVHLPDFTDSAATWRGAWRGLVAELGEGVVFATATSYAAAQGAPRDHLDAVLAATRSARGVRDVVAARH